MTAALGTGGRAGDGAMVVVGGSVAGLSAARELRKHFTGQIHMVDRDGLAPYRRPEVSKSLLGAGEEPRKAFIPWPDDLDLTRHAGTTVTGLDAARRRVMVLTADGETVELDYDGLVVATGSGTRVPLFPHDAACSFSLRTLEDSRRLRGHLASSRRVVIIGGGLIGLEVAAHARATGKETTVIEVAELPLGRVLGDKLATHVLDRHHHAGVQFRLGVGVAEVRGALGAAVVTLTSGEVIEADVVVTAVGSRPEVDWLDGSGVDISDGVACDSDCAVKGVEDVVAAGDVARWFHPLFGREMRVEHWSNAVEQGAFAARRLLGQQDEAGFSAIPYFWSDQGSMRIQVLGSTLGADEVTSLGTPDAPLHEYRREGRLVAVGGVDAGTAVLKARTKIIAELTRS